MCLPHCKHFKTFSVSGTFLEKDKDLDTIKILDEYCRIHLQSQDAWWKSHIVKAIVCPSLHTDLTLGLDFLARNKIMVDAKLRTTIVKETNYDLLNPQVPTLCTPTISPHQCRKAEKSAIKSGQAKTCKFWWLIHCKLMNFFDKNPWQFDCHTYTSESLDIIASIHTQIEQLAGAENPPCTRHKVQGQLQWPFP